MSNEITVKSGISKRAQIISAIMIVIVGMISNYIYCLAIYVNPLSEAHGWSVNMIVSAYSMAMICSFPAFLIGQWFINRFGMKKVLVACGIFYGLAILISGLATNVIVFIASQGVLGALSMYGILIATISIVNILYPKTKGLVMGILYGTQAAGAGLFAPVATYFIGKFSVSAALILQGIVFTIIMFICCMLIQDPTKGDKEMQAKAQAEADMEEQQAAENKHGDKKPTMGWKKALIHPGFWMLFLGIIVIQMIGNVLVTDIPYIADLTYSVNETQSAWVVSAFMFSAGVGGIVVGFVSDRIGPYRTTFYLGIIDGIILLILAILGADSYMLFAIICIVQGFTYNGITALSPIMMTDSYAARDLGIVIAVISIASTIDSIVGPQIGIELPFVPMIGICAGLSLIGGLLTKASGVSLNRYYKSEGTDYSVR